MLRLLKLSSRVFNHHHDSTVDPARHTEGGHVVHEVQVWQVRLTEKGLAAVFDALEAYGMSCEDEVSLLRETDLSTLDMQLNPLPENTTIGE